MELNQHLAAYGLFQHNFAYLDGSATKAIIALMKCDPTSERPLKQRLTFGQRLNLLEGLIENLEDRYDLAKRVPEQMRIQTEAHDGAEHDNPFRDLKEWIVRARTLSSWRNDRVHGRLVFDAATGAAYLVNKQDRVLDADRDTCITKSQEAYQLVDELDFITARCLNDVELTKKIDSI